MPTIQFDNTRDHSAMITSDNQPACKKISVKIAKCVIVQCCGDGLDDKRRHCFFEEMDYTLFSSRLDYFTYCVIKDIVKGIPC